MSRPRSRSPHYRRFPWEEPGFDPYKVVAELDGEPGDSRHHHHHHPREDPEGHWSYAGDDMHLEGPGRSPSFRDDRQFRHQRHPNQEEFHHRRSSPHHDATGYDNRSLSPPREEGGDGERRIGGFREAYPNYENRGKSSSSPPRLKRERLPPTPRSNQDHQEREPGMGWRREGQGRGQGRLRDFSPSGRPDDQRGGAGRESGRRNTQGLNRDKQWEDSYQQRNQHFKRQRREMEDTNHAGFRNEEHFAEQRYQVDSPRDRFQGDPQGGLSRGDNRLSGPVVIEHDHGIQDRREASQWNDFNKRRDRDPEFDRQRAPRPMNSSQERFRTSGGRLEDQDGARPRHFQDNWKSSTYHENKRTPEEIPSLMSYISGNSPMKLRGRGGFHSARGRVSRGHFGKPGPSRTQTHVHQSSQGYQDYPEGQVKPRPGFQPVREVYEDPVRAEPSWADEDRLQERPGSLNRGSPVVDLDPKMPRQRLREWNNQKANKMAASVEETLTIKVDMSQPVHKNSQLCYSSDRQLSLDLVNVGRQRLDFLPMLEHSGTYRETAMHTGTFAQEIITLVHSVKEQYFRGNDVTLNDRFSAPQKDAYQEEETEELTLDERFSSNRGFSLNTNSLLDDEEPLFSRLGPLPPTRGPGDLRHDLEKRRQERLEGVKVTILGNSLPQRSQGRVSEPDLEYSERDDLAQGDDEEFWTEEPNRMREGNMGQRRGAPYRQNMGQQRRNHRFGNRLGQVRRQNFRNNPAGPGW